MYEELVLPELIDRCLDPRTRDRGWDALVCRYYMAVWTFARRLLASVAEAKLAGLETNDVTQTVWLRICNREDRALRDFRGKTEAEWRAYLFQTARNTVIDRLRREGSKRRPPMTRLDPDDLHRVMNDIVDPDLDPAQELEARQLGERIEGALRRHWKDSAPEIVDRDVLISQLHFQHGMSAVAIEAMIDPGITHKGIEKVFDRAKACLQAEFGGPGARSRDLDDGSQREMPDDLHWPDGMTLLRFLAGDIAPQERERRIAHASRCDVCRTKLVDGWQAVLADATQEELAAFARVHPMGEEAAIRSILEIIRSRDRTQGRRTGPVPSPRPIWSRARGMAMVVTIAALLLVSPMVLRLVLDRSDTRVSALVDVGTSRKLDDYAAIYPLQVWGSLRLAQDFTADESAVRRAGEVVEVGDDVRRELSRAVQELQIEFATGDEARTLADSVAHHNALGHLLLAENRLTAAEKSYEAAQELAPDNATALVGRAIVLHRRSQTEELTAVDRQRLLERADGFLVRVSPESAYYEHAIYNRAQIALELGHVDRALALLRELENRESQTRGPWTVRLRQDIEIRSSD